MCIFVPPSDGSSGVLMKDKATYAGIFDCMYVNIYITINILGFENEDFILSSILRDSQGQWHLWRWRVLLLLRLLLFLVEMAAGPSPAGTSPSGTSVWPHRTG